VSLAKRITKFAAGAAFSAWMVLGCSWDYPIWPKNKKSDTALFRFVVNERDGAGYIDRDGKVVIQPTLTEFGNYGEDDFFDGLAKVVSHGEEWYIDATGRRVFQAYYRATGHFSEGLASVTEDGKAGFINREGKLVIPLAFDSVENFSEGLAVASVNGRYGYIDKNGGFVIEPKYVLAMPFSDGAARAIELGQCLYTGYGPCSTGDRVTLPYGANRKQSSNVPRCRYSFIDKKGKRLFENQFYDARDFAEGLAPVGDGNLWGYIDKTGTVAIPVQFEAAGPFAEGLAAIRMDGKWGYIDKNGKIVIPATFPSALDFSERMAVVGDGLNKFWFIDKTGRRAIPQLYTAASGFVMGRAHVRKGVDYYSAKWSYIDRTGRAVFTYSDHSNRKRNEP